MKNTITVSLEFDKQQIWENLVGTGFANTNYWISEVELKTWDTPCSIKVIHEKQDGEGIETTTVSPARIYDAFRELVKEGRTHCGGYQIQDVDNSDACFADLILQKAIFGEQVFG